MSDELDEMNELDEQLDFEVAAPDNIVLDSDEDVFAVRPGERDTPCEFLSGSAGSGKTFEIKRRIAEDPSYAIVSASTGIAAVNLNATTIHSLLGFFDVDSLKDAYLSGSAQRALVRTVVNEGYRNVVIDEVSMISHEMLDLIVRVFDDVNLGLPAHRPSIGLILVGDHCQLPPINDSKDRSGKRIRGGATPWSFHAKSWSRFETHITRLTKIWRQSDPRFLAALNHARRGDGQGAVSALQAAGATFHTSRDEEFDGTTIVPDNAGVDRHNNLLLSRLSGQHFSLPARRWGKQRGEWKNIPDRVQLAEGAYVMLLANKRLDETNEFEYVNGDCGYIVEVPTRDSSAMGAMPPIKVRLVRTGEVVSVSMVVRGMEFKDQPDGFPPDYTRLEPYDDLGGYHPYPHYRPKAKRYVRGQVEYYPIRLAYASTVHKCVDARERIPVFGRGLIKLADVNTGDITPYGPIKAVADSSHPAVTIRTSRGYEIVCSAEHRWQTKHGMVDTKSLSYGDSIQLALERPFPGSGEVPAELAWFMGALVGDGSYSDRVDGTLHMACFEDHKIGDRYKNYLNNVEGLRCEWRNGKRERGLHSTSQPFRRKLLSLGLDYVTAKDKKIPEGIWRSGWTAWGAFLQGLFDTDGHVGKGTVVLTTASAQIAKDVQNMLLALGILSKRRKLDTGYQGKAVRYWQVSIAAAGLSDFQSRVGFSAVRKKEKLASLRPNRKFTRTDGFDEVVAVEPSEQGIAMRDLEIPAPHILAFGPFIGHNCQGLSLDRVQIDFRHWMFSRPAMCYVALSRARTIEGLRIVGQPEVIASRCKIDPEVKKWL